MNVIVYCYGIAKDGLNMQVMQDRFENNTICSIGGKGSEVKVVYRNFIESSVLISKVKIYYNIYYRSQSII